MAREPASYPQSPAFAPRGSRAGEAKSRASNGSRSIRRGESGGEDEGEGVERIEVEPGEAAEAEGVKRIEWRSGQRRADRAAARRGGRRRGAGDERASAG
jgi:hypothetical protein